jgi:type II secretory pathway component GspD/PulD (secretin)
MFLAAFSGLYAQQLDKTISINVTDGKLETVLKEISKKGNINFSYNPRKLPVSARVSLKAENQTIRKVLDDLLTPLKIGYFVSENQVVLKPDDSRKNQNMCAMKRTVKC